MKGKLKTSHVLISIFLIISIAEYTLQKKNHLKLKRVDDVVKSAKPIAETTQLSAYCFANVDGTVYDLGELYDSTTDYFVSSGKNYFYYNFCKYGNTKCQKDNTFVVYYDKTQANSTDCKLLSNTNYEHTPTWKVTRNRIENLNLIEITYPDGDRCPYSNTTTYYSTTYQIKCDMDIARVTVDNPNSISINQCQNVIKMRSKFACPDDNKYSLSMAIHESRIILGLGLMACGIYYCFLAYKYLRYTRILTGMVLTLFITIFIFANNLQVSFTTSKLLAILVVSLIIGYGIGWVISKKPWIVSALLGGFLGFVLAELIFSSIISLLTWNPRAVYYIIFSICVTVGAILGGLYQRHIFIVACGFFGGYAILRVNFIFNFI
jgi:hypothetical protein